MSDLTPEAEALREKLNADGNWMRSGSLSYTDPAQMIARTIVEEHHITRELLDRLSSGNPLERTAARVVVHKLAATLLELAGADHGE